MVDIYFDRVFVQKKNGLKNDFSVGTLLEKY